jgi:hypothetical protein
MTRSRSHALGAALVAVLGAFTPGPEPRAQALPDTLTLEVLLAAVDASPAVGAARLGADASTVGARGAGLVMHVYLDGALKRYRREGRLTGTDGLHAALEEGAVDRLRPKLTTVLTDIVGLMPVMLGVGLGSEVMKRIAAPVVGGLLTSTVHTLIMIPALYAVIQGRRLRRAREGRGEDGRPFDEAGPAFNPLAAEAANMNLIGFPVDHGDDLRLDRNNPPPSSSLM